MLLPGKRAKEVKTKMPMAELPKAHSLKEYEGKEIELVSYREYSRADGTKAYVGKMPDGEQVWLPSHVVKAFENGDPRGRYTVVSFISKQWGTKGYGLKNAPNGHSR